MNRNYERHTDWPRPLSAQVAHADDPHTPTEAELIDLHSGYDPISPDTPVAEEPPVGAMVTDDEGYVYRRDPGVESSWSAWSDGDDGGHRRWDEQMTEWEGLKWLHPHMTTDAEREAAGIPDEPTTADIKAALKAHPDGDPEGSER